MCLINQFCSDQTRGNSTLISRVAQTRIVIGAYCVAMLGPLVAQPVDAVGIGKWVSLDGNFTEAGYRKTQFFDPRYNTAVLQWDIRAEVWLPPGRDKISWGPYLRIAGIAGSRSDAWQNAWLGGPGVGVQLYPFSSPRFRARKSVAGRWLGPLRVFAEYNRTVYWGRENEWRPDKQVARRV
jgi:hypothetical protein